MLGLAEPGRTIGFESAMVGLSAKLLYIQLISIRHPIYGLEPARAPSSVVQYG